MLRRVNGLESFIDSIFQQTQNHTHRLEQKVDTINLVTNATLMTSFSAKLLFWLHKGIWRLCISFRRPRGDHRTRLPADSDERPTGDGRSRNRTHRAIAGAGRWSDRHLRRGRCHGAQRLFNCIRVGSVGDSRIGQPRPRFAAQFRTDGKRAGSGTKACHQFRSRQTNRSLHIRLCSS